MKVSYNPSFMFQKNGIKHGISPEIEEKWQQHVTDSIARVNSNIQSQEYGFIEVLQDKSGIQHINQTFSSLRWAKTLVVIGIGGSDLGARAVLEALRAEHAPMDVIFHGDSTDPVAISRLLQVIDIEDTVFCIISKSGETIETISQYVFLKDVVKKQTEDWAEHFLFITDQHKGILRTEADKYGVLTLPIPDTVGGRFSVLTAVGLLPSVAAGVDIQRLIDGAISASQEMKELAAEIARTQFLLYQAGLKVNILMPYSIQLQEFGRWYRQLWAESLGKDGKGILPIKAWGPADQHSQVQFYTDGTLLHSLFFVRVEKQEDDYTIEGVDVEGVEYLEGHSFHEILNYEQEATALALRKLGRPSATLSVDSLDAYSLGQLFMIFELAVVYLGEMLEIDAFNQPGVEEGKQMMYALLGRKEYAAKKKEIEQLQQS